MLDRIQIRSQSSLVPRGGRTRGKMMTLVALAGGDCIDDADVLRTTACTLGGTVKAPSTLGLLRSFLSVNSTG